MNVTVVFHCPMFDATRLALANAIMAANSSLVIEAVSRSEELAARLLEPLESVALVVLRVRDERDLARLIPLRETLRRVRLVILLPATDPSTVALAHTFHPCLMLYDEGDFPKLTAVVQHLLASSAAACTDSVEACRFGHPAPRDSVPGASLASRDASPRNPTRRKRGQTRQSSPGEADSV